MKKAVFGLFVLGLTNLVVAQSSVKEFNIALVPAFNSTYVESNSDGLTPSVVGDLQIRAAGYDPTSLKDFDNKSKEFFEVVHKASNGQIITFYDRTGKIVSTMERFTDVRLPLQIRTQLFEENGDWKMVGNTYRSIYTDGQVVKKSYKVKLQQGNRTKKVSIDVL